MISEPPSASLIGALGWRQGSFLPANLITQLQQAGELSTEYDPEELRFLVVGQDCDVVHPSYEAEPWCEILIARPVEAPNGNYQWGKSPRYLHFDIPRSGAFECSIHERLRFPRHYLTTTSPSAELALDETTLYNLRRWLGQRYARVALPDAFNLRSSKVQRKVIKALESIGSHVSEVYLMGVYEEMAPGEDYEVALIAAMFDDAYDDEQQRDAVETALARVAGLLEKCDGIKAPIYLVRARRDLSLSEIDHMRRWDYLDPISNSSFDS